MKKILSLSVALLVLVFMSGCGKSNAMLHSHINKMNQRNEKKHGSMHSSSPDFIYLSQKAQGQRGKYILEFISKLDKNPNTILTKIIDPAKDKKAKLRADRLWRDEKKRIKALGKLNGWGSKTLRILKETKKEVYKPVSVVLDTPYYIDEINIQNIYKKHMTYGTTGTTLKIQSCIITFSIEKYKTVFETQQSIMKEFDEVLVKNGWGKTIKVDETNQKDAIENYKELKVFYKQRLKEISSSDIQTKQYIIKQIQEIDNLIKSTKKKLKKFQNNKMLMKNTILYMFRYKAPYKTSINNSFTIAIITGHTNVLMRVSKIEHLKSR